jgi:hypothetical protein
MKYKEVCWPNNMTEWLIVAQCWDAKFDFVNYLFDTQARGRARALIFVYMYMYIYMCVCVLYIKCFDKLQNSGVIYPHPKKKSSYQRAFQEDSNNRLPSVF